MRNSVEAQPESTRAADGVDERRSTAMLCFRQVSVLG